MDLRVTRRHKKREGKVERDLARVFYRRLSPVLLKIQFNSFFILFHLSSKRTKTKKSPSSIQQPSATSMRASFLHPLTHAPPHVPPQRNVAGTRGYAPRPSQAPSSSKCLHCACNRNSRDLPPIPPRARCLGAFIAFRTNATWCLERQTVRVVSAAHHAWPEKYAHVKFDRRF